jgi:tRNA(Ile)-lysidine synthase
MNAFARNVHDYIRSNSLLSGGERILFSLSAGKDSMAMLHVFLELRELLAFDAGIFHLNHMMRGSESDDDEKFLRELAGRLGIPIYCRSFDFSGDCRHRQSFEEYAREIRYSMLEDIRLEKGFDLIATAHNLEDNAETLLMRLFQGTGIFGLRGIPAKRGNVIRPMRGSPVSEILGYLRGNDIAWREDSSNRDEIYRRNYIRNSIAPVVSNAFPGYAGALHNLSLISSDYMRLVDSMISRIHGEIISSPADGSHVIASGRIDHERSLFYHVMSGAMSACLHIIPTTAVLDEIWKNYQRGRSHCTLYVNGSHVVKKTLLGGERCVMMRTVETAADGIADEWEYEVRPEEGVGEIYIEEIGLRLKIFCRDYEYFLGNRSDKNSIFVTIDNRNDLFHIRNRRAGDRIRLESGSKKIKELLIEKKLDNENKKRVPLLILNSGVAAVMTGFVTDIPSRVAASSRVRENSENVLVITRCDD